MGHFVYMDQDSMHRMHSFYNKAVGSLAVPYEDSYIQTAFGATHVVVVGDKAKKPIFTLHGGNGITPLNLRLLAPLLEDHCIIAPDVIGMPGKSEPYRNMNIHKNDYADWLIEVLDALGMEQVVAVVSSYSASMLLSLAKFHPDRISQAVLLVPSGIAHGPILPMMRKMALPFMKYYLHPSPKALEGILDTMIEESDELLREFMDLMMSCYKMEMRPPKQYKREELRSFSVPVLVIASPDDIFFPDYKVFPAADQLFDPNIRKMRITGKHLPSKSTMIDVCKAIDKFENEGILTV